MKLYGIYEWLHNTCTIDSTGVNYFKKLKIKTSVAS